jgi:hypothetical protein
MGGPPVCRIAGRLSNYAAALSAGLDASMDQMPYEPSQSSRRPPLSNVLCIRVRRGHGASMLMPDCLPAGAC